MYAFHCCTIYAPMAAAGFSCIPRIVRKHVALKRCTYPTWVCLDVEECYAQRKLAETELVKVLTMYSCKLNTKRTTFVVDSGSDSERICVLVLFLHLTQGTISLTGYFGRVSTSRRDPALSRCMWCNSPKQICYSTICVTASF